MLHVVSIGKTVRFTRVLTGGSTTLRQFDLDKVTPCSRVRLDTALQNWYHSGCLVSASLDEDELRAYWIRRK